MGNLLLQNGTQKIKYWSYYIPNDNFSPNTLMLKDDETVIDGMTAWYNNYPVTIFVLQMASKKTKLLFGSDAPNAYSNEAQDQNALKKGLARILNENKSFSYIVTVPEQEIAPFMCFIKKVENPIKNLQNIHPESYYIRNNLYPFSS